MAKKIKSPYLGILTRVLNKKDGKFNFDWKNGVTQGITSNGSKVMDKIKFVLILTKKPNIAIFENFVLGRKQKSWQI